MVFYKKLLLTLCVPGIVVLSACTSENRDKSVSASDRIFVTSEATATMPSKEEASSYLKEAEEKTPKISPEDQERGIAEGNIYVVYAHVMCFGGVLGTPEEYASTYVPEIHPDTPEEYKVKYDETPQEVKEQSSLNDKTLSFQAPQECIDAGWSNL